MRGAKVKRLRRQYNRPTPDEAEFIADTGVIKPTWRQFKRGAPKWSKSFFAWRLRKKYISAFNEFWSGYKDSVLGLINRDVVDDD